MKNTEVLDVLSFVTYQQACMPLTDLAGFFYKTFRQRKGFNAWQMMLKISGTSHFKIQRRDFLRLGY